MDCFSRFVQWIESGLPPIEIIQDDIKEFNSGIEVVPSST